MTDILQLGDRGQSVTELQKALAKALKITLVADGIFGPFTKASVERFQKANGITATGAVGPITAAKLGIVLKPSVMPLLAGKALPRSEAGFTNAAAKLGIEVAVMKAIVKVESAGKGFLDNGMIKNLFERHKFWEQLVVPHDELTNLFERRSLFAQGNPDICGPRAYSNKKGTPLHDAYVSGMANYARLERARQFDDTAALKACSWGLGQIMGFHAETLGYGTVQEMVRLFGISEDNQIDGMARFILATPRALKGARLKDWDMLASAYNGKAYKKFAYDTKLAAAYRTYA